MVTSKSMHYKRLILTISVLISLLFLLYFKYANFFIENLNLALVSAHSDKIINWPKVILPIGISFFTFQKITYSIDIYRVTHSLPKTLPFICCMLSCTHS